MTQVIGLTGSIASGKSTVSLMFDDIGIPVIDADKIARIVVRPGEKAYHQIIEHFGEGILREDKTIDRKKLGSIVFKDEEKRKVLNQMVHPAVRERMIKERDLVKEKNEKAVVLDIPLLFESKLEHLVDWTLVVFVNEEVQLKRLMDRDGYTEEEALDRIQSQIPVFKKASQADEVINNNSTKDDAYQQLIQILRKRNLV
ncbi:dephospho-CoA kinase [Bacillaceae bacterium S4-13-58]